MSEYDEPDDREPTLGEEVAHAAKAAVVLRIEGYNAENIERMVADQIAEMFVKRHEDALRLRTEKAVDETVASVTEARIAAEVERLLSEGWTSYTEWGSVKSKATLQERLRGLFFEERSWGYNDPKRTWAEKIGAEILEKSLRDAFAKEIGAAQLRFREAVDLVIQSKLAESLKSALGLR